MIPISDMVSASANVAIRLRRHAAQLECQAAGIHAISKTHPKSEETVVQSI
jgi:hypothetical protein